LSFLFIMSTGLAQVTKINAPDYTVEDCFGWSVSIYGDYAIIGNVYDDDNDIQSGSAYIYLYDGSNWVEQDKIIASDGGFADYFGYAVSIHDDQLISGAYRDFVGPVRSGSAYIYHRSGSEWIEAARLVPFDPEEEDRFGAKVDIQGDFAAVGSYFDDDYGESSGSVYVYQKNDETWSFHQKLTPPDLQANDLFGVSVDLSEDYLFIGAIGNSAHATNSGKVYIYELIEDEWELIGEIFPNDPRVDQNFGNDISADDDHLIVSANMDNELGAQSGAVYVFGKTNDNWIQLQKLLPDDGQLGAAFGNTVSIHEDHLVVGSVNNLTQHGESGAIYIYSLDIDDIWIQSTKIVPADGHNQQRFGADVGIWKNNVITGAPYDGGMGYRCGASYIFDLDIILKQNDNNLPTHKLSCYPNPTTGEITLYSSGMIMPYTVEVFDARGTAINQFMVDTPLINFSLSGIPSGIYQLRASSRDGSSVVRKIIVR